MSKAMVRVTKWLVAPIVFAWGVVGCSGSNGLPDAVTVELPDGTTVSADKGAGVESLANTNWSFYRAAGNGQGAVFVTIAFNEDGTLERFDNNTLASAIFGSTIYFDGARHNTTQPGLTYSAATYGAQTADASGFVFAGRFTAFAAGLQAANGEASATGTFDPDDPTTMRGTFYFKSEVTLIDYPEGNTEEEFDFVAQIATNE